jgi:hypothetical protein
MIGSSLLSIACLAIASTLAPAGTATPGVRAGLTHATLAAPAAPGLIESMSEAEALALGVEAYIYFYPLISMEVTRRVTNNLPAGVKPGLGPANAFHHMKAFPDANFREVVRPNFDTLYSSAWLDLTREPMIVSAPDTGGRHYLLPMLDMWSDVFAVPGKRTSGTGPGQWAVVPPGWQGELPAGVARIDAPTAHVWIIGRTQTNGPADYDAVHAVQAGYTITPLSQWGKTLQAPTFKPDPTVDMKTPPIVQIDTMPAAAYFALAARLLKDNPPHATDWSQMSRLRHIGIEVGKPFDMTKLPPAVQAGLAKAPEAAQAVMAAKKPTLAKVVNGWQMNVETMGVYGNAYLKRAIVAQVGLGANQPEDAIYPLCVGDADGKPLVGEAKYVLRFEKSELPPVDAFWSVTMYDGQGFQVANPINRFAIGDRDALKYGADGSLEILIQAESPGKDLESNWLPAPKSGQLGVTMRLYAPRPQALDGRWSPPAIRRVK